MAKPRVGVQLIVFGRRTGEDLRGTLRAVAAAGYDGYEGGTPTEQAAIDQWKAAMKETGLVCAGCHAGFEGWNDPKTVQARIAGVKALGSKYLITSGRSDWKSIDEYVEAAKAMNQAGKQCRGEGVVFCYHNHYWEFKKIENQTPMHVMAAALDPASVKLCPDVYWVHVGGEMPADFISCYAQRIPYYHFKDGLGGEQYREFRELGTGNVDLPAALQAALTTNPEWIVAEQDTSQLDPAESVRISREYLKSLGV